MNGDDQQVSPEGRLRISIYPPKSNVGMAPGADPTGGFTEVSKGQAPAPTQDTGGFTEVAAPQEDKPSLLRQALEPITSILSSYRELEQKGRQ